MDINRCREESLTTMVRGTSRYTGESAAQVCWTASSGGLAENSWSALLLSLPAGPGPSLLCAVRPPSACVRASAGRCQQGQTSEQRLRTLRSPMNGFTNHVFLRADGCQLLELPASPQRHESTELVDIRDLHYLVMYTAYSVRLLANTSTARLSRHCLRLYFRLKYALYTSPPPPNPFHQPTNTKVVTVQGHFHTLTYEDNLTMTWFFYFYDTKGYGSK